MVRGSGKYKVKRGGGRQFTEVRNMTLDEDGVAVNKWSRSKKRESEEESEEEEGEEDDADGDAEENKESAGGTSKGIVPSTAEDISATRSARKEGEKKDKAAAGSANDEDEDGLPVNANRLAVNKPMDISDIGTPREPSRKEREAKSRQAATKLHQQGKTDQAKADLARLAQIRKQREEAAAARKAADQAKAVEAEARRKK